MRKLIRASLVTALSAVAVLQATTPASAAAAPAAPQLNSVGSSASAGLVVLTFTDKSTNEEALNVQRRVPGGSWQTVHQIPGTGSTGTQHTVRFEHQPLPLEQCYRVKAFNDDGASYSRDWCSEPGIPDQLTLISKTATSVTMSWRDRAFNERYSDLYAGYASDHELSLGVVAHWGTLPDRHTISTVTIRNLRPNIVYEFSVKASNNVGSNESNPRLTVRTPPA